MNRRIYELSQFEPQAKDSELWELFHDNSKVELNSPIVPPNEVLSRMEQTSDSLEFTSREQIPLPSVVDSAAPNGLQELLRRRVSERDWSLTEIKLSEIATLLQSYAVTRDNQNTEFLQPFRAVPSGGGLFPLELYVSVRNCPDLDAGLYHYSPRGLSLTRAMRGDQTAALADCFVQQDVVYNAAVTILITGMFSRSTFKYGNRGYRFTLMEAGHLAQNLCLFATEMGLSNLCMGGYFDRRLDKFLELDGVTQSAVYAFSAGRKIAVDSTGK
jgi:SagB-type dehydrogenase family enzyme